MSYIYENERDYDYCDNRPACRTYNRAPEPEVGSQPCRSVSQGVGRMFCLPKTAWPPTSDLQRKI